jgi:MFS transporter, DHA2 family, methylenomycin A resistance protein
MFDVGRFSREKLYTLTASCLAYVVISVDVTVVNVALEGIKSTFHSNISYLQWIVNSYTLALAGCLLSGGALSDQYGAKSVFLLGTWLFAVSSVLCGVSFGVSMLIICRAAQGIGAALCIPASLALLHEAFTEDKSRTYAASIWAAAGGISLAAGPLVGGLLIYFVGWRSIFFINLPICLLSTVAVWRSKAESTRRLGRKVDVLGQILAILSLIGLLFALTSAGGIYPASFVSLSWFGGFILCSAMFILVERQKTEPMIDFLLFRANSLGALCGTALLLNFSAYGSIFVLSIFFQSVWNFNALETGLALLPMTAFAFLINIISGKLSVTFGTRIIALCGILVSVVAYFLLFKLILHWPFYRIELLLGFAGGGISLALPPLISIMLAESKSNEAGIRSGIFNTARQLGGAIGVATFGSVMNSVTNFAVSGVQASFGIATAALSLALVLGTLFIRVRT